MVTFFGLLLTPVFYVTIRRFVEKREAKKRAALDAAGLNTVLENH